MFLWDFISIRMAKIVVGSLSLTQPLLWFVSVFLAAVGFISYPNLLGTKRLHCWLVQIQLCLYINKH
jgi:hypothetical protein